MASNSDPARFRHRLLENYEEHWFNVSTLKHYLNPDLERVIDDIHTAFVQLEPEVKDLLTKLQIRSQIDAINKRYFSIKRIGDRETWQQIEQDSKLLDDVVSGIEIDDIVVCMVEVVSCKENHEFPHQKDKRKVEEIVKKNFKIEVSKPSLLLLKTILSLRPENVEIVILSDEGIHATDAKSIVFKTLKEMDTKIPETMHHAAETDIEEIVEQRVNAAIHNIRMTAQSLSSSFPEMGLIVHYITFAFDDKASQAHISSVATNLDLTVGNAHIGSVQDGPLLYYNEIKIREIKHALIEKCSKKVVDEIKTDVQNDISNHIVNELQAKDIFKGRLEEVFEGLVQSLGLFFGILIGTLFLAFYAIYQAPILVVTSVFRIFSPVNVNDPEWRRSCVDVVYDKLQEKKSSMVSDTSRSMDQIFSSYSLKLHRFLRTFPPDSKFRYSLRYDVIGPSPVKSSQFGEYIAERPCIVFVCIGKGFKPLGEPWYPKTLHGIDIDVREGYFNQSVCTRCSVGVRLRSISTGSCGFLANKIGDKSKQGIITAAHVVVEKDILYQSIQFQKEHVSTVTLEVVSPSNVDSKAPKENRIYGKVSDIHFGKWRHVGVDAAFVEKLKQTPFELNFHINAGILSNPIFTIDKDSYPTVEKCGRTTARTSGYLTSQGNVCKSILHPLNNLFLVLENQYYIQSSEVFLQPGDSGSGVYLEKQGNYHPIGIAHAAGTADGNTCYVTPIKYVLEALNLEMT